jgi:hypothetical protein
MAKPKVPIGSSTQGSKPSRAEMARAIHSKHQHIREAVHKVLHEAGLKGVALHSIRFSVTHDSVSGPGCDPPCPAGQDCVVDSSGGQVRWVCVPQ